jgi:hypothetical protein
MVEGRSQQLGQGQGQLGHFRRLVDQTSTCNPGAPGSSNIKERNKKDNKRTGQQEKKEEKGETGLPAKKTDKRQSRQRLLGTWSEG